MPGDQVDGKSWKRGGCHCGGVSWQALISDVVVARKCNCSICHRTGYLHLFAPQTDFTLLGGDQLLTSYTFNSGVARHMFCRACGVKSFYVPRSHPDSYSLNLRCMDQNQFTAISIKISDGQKWENNIEELRSAEA